MVSAGHAASTSGATNPASSTGYGERRPCLLKTKEPTYGLVQLGKICRVRGSNSWAYVNNISARLRQKQAFGVAPCVRKLMQAWDIPHIHYWDRRTNTTYIARREAIPRVLPESISYRGAYFYLEISEWGRVDRKLYYEWVPKGQELELRWLHYESQQELIERELGIKQPALF